MQKIRGEWLKGAASGSRVALNRAFEVSSPLGTSGFNTAQYIPTTRPAVERTAYEAFLPKGGAGSLF